MDGRELIKQIRQLTLIVRDSGLFFERRKKWPYPNRRCFRVVENSYEEIPMYTGRMYDDAALRGGIVMAHSTVDVLGAGSTSDEKIVDRQR
jgi:hypothetical protein